MTGNRELLSMTDIRTKIRKAVNDRYNKLSSIQQGLLENLNIKERELKRKEFLADLESKLTVHLHFYKVLDYYPKVGKTMEFGNEDDDASVRSER